MTTHLRVAIPAPVRQLFDYLPPEEADTARLAPGVRLLVPFGRRRVVGYLLETSDQAEVGAGKLRRVLSILDGEPLLSAADCAFLRWAAAYYHHPIGEVFAAAFPVLLRQGRSAPAMETHRLLLTAEGHAASRDELARARRQLQLFDWLRSRADGIAFSELGELAWNWRTPARALIARGWAEIGAGRPAVAKASPRPIPDLTLSIAQEQVLDRLRAAFGCYGAFLLEGVTGSGKTEVYLRAVEHVLARGDQAMILLPEISLTPQLETDFRRRFSEAVVVFHSGLNESERCRAWLAMQRGEAAVLLGTRSAVFTPLRRPGLIVLDEEHDSSFKQQDGFRYSARDLAVMRARRLNVPILLGSATPSLESVRNASEGRYHHLRLPERVGAARAPVVRIIDIRGQSLREGLSAALSARINDVLARKEQAMLFLNRRGYAPTLICHGCGWVAECRRCDAHLVIHAKDRRLRCHHCGAEHELTERCPVCLADDLRPLGLGTERVEKALAELFPNARIARIDRDTTRRKGSLAALLDAARAGEIDLLLGTQMLAKGHHFPKLTLVGLLDVDAGFYSLDFRAGERTAQLIMQVAGRAGRENRAGEVVLQTRHPDHPLLQVLLRSGYSAFAAAALQERRAMALPPYSHQALWRAESADAEAPRVLLERIKTWTDEADGRVTGWGPIPAPLTRLAGRWRWHYLLQCAERRPLHALVESLLQRLPGCPEARRARWSVDIDPIEWS